MNYLVSPFDLVFLSKARIAGFSEMLENNGIYNHNLLEIALQVAEDWTNNWEEGQGFGSSDRTYMLQDFIQNVISFAGLNDKYTTSFAPSLEVFKK